MRTALAIAKMDRPAVIIETFVEPVADTLTRTEIATGAAVTKTPSPLHKRLFGSLFLRICPEPVLVNVRFLE